MKSFVNFLPPWVETNIQPAFYDKESGTVLQQTARMYAKVNQLIRKFNEIAERFNYIENYFENLDLQEEVNKKLDEMVEDGTFARIINEEIFGDFLVEIGDSHNPIHYGADPTGVEDSTQAINDCIDANKGGTVQFTQGVYKVTGQILLPFAQDEKVSIYGNGATIKASGEIQYLFFVGYDRVSDQNDVGFKSCIKDLYIDGTDADIEYAVYSVKGYKDLHLDNVNVYRCKNGILIGETTGVPADVLWSNSIIYGNGSEYEGTGVISNCSDNYFSNLRIYGFRVGFEINSYVTIECTHVLLRWADQTTSNFDPYPVGSVIFNGYYEQTMFAEVNDSCKMIGCYADSTYKFLNITTNQYVILANSFYFNARTGIDQHIIDCERNDTKLTVANCEFSLSQGNNTSIIRCTHSEGIFSGYAQLSFSGIEIRGIANLTNNFDYALIGYEVKVHANINANANTWVIIGVLNNVSNYLSADVSLFINAWQYNTRINLNTSNSDAEFRQYNSSNTATTYTAGVIYDTTKHVALLVIKSSTNLSNVKLDIKLNSTTNLAWQIQPIKNSSMFDSTRLLSEYTDLVPSKTLVLNTANNIRTAS